MDLNKVYQGDCFQLIDELEDESVDLIVTSPPYADMKSYGKKVNVLHPDRYNDWLMPLFEKAYHKLKPTGSFIINIGDKTQNKCRHTYALDLPGKVISETRLKLYDRYFWYKQGLPNGSSKRLINWVEFIYHFVKSQHDVKWNMDNVRTPHSKVSLDRIKSGVGQYVIGEDGKKEMKEQKKCTLNPKGKTPEGIFYWTSNRKTRGNEHPAPFPIELPEWFILALTDDNDLIIDPFLGSGTSAEAAQKLNRNFIGFELNEEYVEMANRRLEESITGEKEEKESKNESILDTIFQ